MSWIQEGEFSEGFAVVKNANDEYGYIDKTNRIVIPCEWEWTSDFREGLGRVRMPRGRVSDI